ncbi:UsfY protein [Mycobacterium sp. NS-7484]|uniref:protein UsfY n=1 Tax=unclassified Mycobacterium TaxID=2642494 RepID=UPI0007FE9121|nr:MULTISPECIES: protein UsfY [unclassified Mycobacterium]OBG86677.1 UsfY protein [Mycobacterium sp. E802]OMB92898.1 UsfY protein [Mycobacterium sp. NS-7484]
MKGPKDPVDHARTTRPHAGESMKDNVIMPAVVLILMALVLFVGTLAAFATGNSDVGFTVGALSAAGFLIGSVWLAIEHMRVRRIEDRWYTDHPGVMRQHPSS